MQTKNRMASTNPTVTGGVSFSWEYVKHWPHEKPKDMDEQGNIATPAAYQWYYDEKKRIYKPLI